METIYIINEDDSVVEVEVVSDDIRVYDEDLCGEDNSWYIGEEDPF